MNRLLKDPTLPVVLEMPAGVTEDKYMKKLTDDNIYLVKKVRKLKRRLKIYKNLLESKI